MPVQVKCQECGKLQEVQPARAKTYRFCSYACRGQWRAKNWIGENHPRWLGGEREKVCEHCEQPFSIRPNRPITTFKKQKFCSKKCADEGGFRYSGENHPNYRKDARRKNRGGAHHKWVNAVISRDNATCQWCGATRVELHAHHIKSYQDHPDLRFDVDNGVTVCALCHWNFHSAGNDNGVNSGEPLTGDAEGNPEPSLNGNVQEGVTTRGRAYRRWEGGCEFCGCFISRRLSDVKNNKHVFCSKSCKAKWQWRNGGIRQ